MSTSPSAIITFIRFQLSELRARNGHHEFEHLCRHLARLRIYSNVLPATGPVGVGGDQGRDFETFSSAVTWSLSPSSDFSALASGTRRVAFACTIQEMSIDAKIKSDIKSITERGRFAEVVYFSESNVPVARRHALQEWAKIAYQLELQLFDGQAIAELLSDRDTFWIAQEYLRIPAELIPPVGNEPTWYRAALDRWGARQPLPISQADFVDIKGALRHATFNVEARVDLLFWLKRMDRFLEPEAPRALERSACYEVAVASFRGKGEMTSRLSRVRDYYSDLEQWGSFSDLQDAAVLAVYAYAAWSAGALGIDHVELFGWRHRLASFIDRCIAEAAGPGRRCSLLQVRGYLWLMPAEPGLSADLNDGLRWWNQLLDEVNNAPLFPVENFADLISYIATNLGHDPRLEALAGRVDTIVAKRAGGAIAAEKMFARTESYWNQGDLLITIELLHRTHRGWFTGETIHRFQDSLFFLAECYEKAHLLYASKYCALAAAYNALQTHDEHVALTQSKALFAAADADDSAGASLSYIQLLRTAIGVHVQVDTDPLHMQRHPGVQVAIGQVAALRGLARRVSSSHVAAVDEVLSLWPPTLRDGILVASNDDEGFWMKGTWDDAWSQLESGFLGRPFGDSGKNRIVEWKALGIEWQARFPNTYNATPKAEQFIAQLQLAHAVLARQELCLIPTRVSFDLRLEPKAKRPRLIVANPNGAGQPQAVPITVVLPGRSTLDIDEARRDAIAVIAGIMRAGSLLPQERFFEAIKEPLVELLSRVLLIRPYEEIYREYISQELFQEATRRAAPALLPERPFKLREHPALAWASGLGPTYSPDEARKRIRRRYETGQHCVALTVRALNRAPQVRRRLEQMHRDGLKDWEILSIIMNAATNLRTSPPRGSRVMKKSLDRFRAAFDIKEESPLDPALFSDELLQSCRIAFLGAFAAGWNLSYGNVTDLAALETFLVQRYGLRSDDEAHDDIFGWAGNDQAWMT